MNSNSLQRLVDIARAMKPLDHGGKSFHVSFAVQQGKVIGIGTNNYHKVHPYHRFGKYKAVKVSYSSQDYKPCLHSEAHLAIKLGRDTWSGLEIVNVRISSLGKLTSARPCINCDELIIEPLDPKRVYYSTNEGTFLQL